MLYVHIPFCKTRCIYCAFASSTMLQLIPRYVSALCHELKCRADYLPSHAVQSVYLGGGTPSLLPNVALEQLFTAIHQYLRLQPNAEVTVECNPDDVTPSLVQTLRTCGVNRVSMGVQSFCDHELRLLHRRHTAQQAREAVAYLISGGIHNVSIDLMYGLPYQTLGTWQRSITEALRLPVQHISAYCLSVEDGTPLQMQIAQKAMDELPEDLALTMFQTVCHRLLNAGFEHYEISNFCRPSYRAQHNTGYWSGLPYLGVGAAAHSYNGSERRWNTSDVRRYCEAMEHGIDCSEAEHLTFNMRYNEFVFTGLRRAEGINLQQMEQRFGKAQLGYCLHEAQKHIAAGRLICTNNQLRLTESGIFVSDDIMSDLCLVE